MSRIRPPQARPIGRLFDWVHGHVLIPAYETGVKRRRTFAHRRALEESQWWSRDRIEALQVERLRQLLTHAAGTCPAYRDLWTSLDLAPDRLRTLEDLRRWPITGKAFRRAHRAGIRSQSVGRLLSKGTSGSSGEPFAIDYDEGSLERRMAAAFRGYAWAGAPPGAKQFYFWGEPVLPRPLRARSKDRLHHWLYRRHLHNSLNFRDDAVHDVLRRYERARAAVVVAFTRPLYEWARVLHARGLRPTPPHAIIVGAEKLYDFQRQLIEEVFSAPVFETYGSREVMLIAAECDRHTGLHLTSEHLVVEIVDERGEAVGPGVEGRVVVTDLFNYGAPFVRYDIGDHAVASGRRCSCDRGLPLLERVIGRQLEIVLTPDGRRIPGEGFVFIFKDQFDVARYQVVQESAARLVVSVEPREEWPAAARAEALAALHALVGEHMVVDLRIVDAIDDGPGGKLGLVRNPWLVAERAREHEGSARP